MLKQFCSRCGQALEADESWAGQRLNCPGCGLMLQWPRGANSFRRRQWLTALAALALVALLVWLWLRPSAFGPGGGAARAAILGRHLAGLAGGDAPDLSGSPESSSQTNMTATNRNGVAPATAPLAPAPPRAPAATPPENTPPTAPAGAPAPPSSSPPATNSTQTNAPAPATLRLRDDFSQRLAAAGAKTGEVQISLIWNNVNDLDLHCVDPSGEEIFFGDRRSSFGGELDVDRNAGFPLTAEPVENIYWPATGAPLGAYEVSVVHYRNWGARDPTAYQVRILVRGREMVFNGSISFSRANPVHRFVLGPKP